MKVLITGTSKGIGKALAEYYLNEEATVYGISRNANAELNNYEKFRFLSQDISDFESLRQILPAFIEENGSFNLVILNAGVLPEIKDMKDTSLEEIHRIMNVNVWANKIIIDILFQRIRKIEQVVAISSGAAKSGSRGWNAYSLSKATLNMLINLYSKEHPETHFSSLAPGIIDTSMQDYISSLPDDDRFPVVSKLKSMKGTEDMPEPSVVAHELAGAIRKIKNMESGAFHDVRNLSVH